jgi:hypothetical protein
MDEKVKQILLDVLDNLNDSKYELENLNAEELKNEIEEVIYGLEELIDKLENLLK